MSSNLKHKNDNIPAADLMKAAGEHREVDVQDVHAQKMESVGRLAAGIAHEINTPAQFIGDHVWFFRDAFKDLEKVIRRFQVLLKDCEAGCPSQQTIDEIKAQMAEVDLEYLLSEIPEAIEVTQEGVGRISSIVMAMKEFSHPAGTEKAGTDINRTLENTITVARNEWKYVAEVVTDFDSNLLEAQCLSDEINQVFLNIIINAAHAIAEALPKDSDQKGIITVTTRADGDWAEVLIADTGTGIPPKAQPRIFDPFFSTKDVGKGTGQGLSIAYDIVVNKHQGTITFETQEGCGTTFIIRIPLETPSTPST